MQLPCQLFATVWCPMSPKNGLRSSNQEIEGFIKFQAVEIRVQGTDKCQQLLRTEARMTDNSRYISFDLMSS